MQNIAQAEDIEEFLDGAKPLNASMPPSFNNREFTNEIIEDFDTMKHPSYIARDDYCVRIFHMLRRSRGKVKILLSAIIRAVSKHNLRPAGR